MNNGFYNFPSLNQISANSASYAISSSFSTTTETIPYTIDGTSPQNLITGSIVLDIANSALRVYDGTKWLVFEEK
jgi:hypothetical protein